MLLERDEVPHGGGPKRRQQAYLGDVRAGRDVKGGGTEIEECGETVPGADDLGQRADAGHGIQHTIIVDHGNAGLMLVFVGGEAHEQLLAGAGCHTDLHYHEGGINDDFPFLLGHEAAGIVESVGAGVTEVAPGDFVVLNWRAICGRCRACRRGRPQYCFDTHNARQRMALTDGTELSPALGIGAFAEKPLVAAGQCTKVDPAASPGSPSGAADCPTPSAW